jgi:hypothetical protein
MNPRKYTAPWRWAWTLPVLAASFVVACEGDLGTGLNEQDWGFLFLNAAKNTSGQYVTAPEAIFFRGALNSVPNASITTDSCNDGLYTGSGNTLTNVTFLDAGVPVTTTIGTRSPDELPRNASVGEITYELPSGQTIPYTPGDSVLLTVPGAVGGFAASTIRAKTAEAFTIDPVDVPSGGEAIQLRWTPSQDPRSALILELRYNPTGGANPTRELLCAFADDGIDSISFNKHQPWSAGASSARQVVATRLRTSYTNTSSGALLGVISTFAVPTPPVP